MQLRASSQKVAKSAVKGKRSSTSKKQPARKIRKARVQRGRTAAWSVLRKAGLKPPKSAYVLWLKQNYARILKDLGPEAKFAAATKRAGEVWSALADVDMEPFVKEYKAMQAHFHQVQDTYKEYTAVHALTPVKGVHS
ncbi:unnamed protein product [Polarella glacialis]|uniref:HMG box domain-containing protein n=1 Tax=Polarella glacialis TaxID=89957 RepID=A0A813DWR1_POLGL|nr:unnamed protein product [Polarella glacialis]